MSPPRRIKVMVVDDHALFRAGLRDLLEEDHEVEVVTEAAGGEEAVEKARTFVPDVVIMDVRLPGMGGIEATRLIKKEHPPTEVVIISAIDDEEQIVEAIEAGATGYLIKDDEPESVVSAIHQASQGKAYLTPDVARRVLDRFATALAGKHHRRGSSELTPRETTILQLMATGKRNREIAQRLGISERTVGNHIANIYSKLQIQDRAQAILYAIQKGLVRI
ncbi:MAG: response regulator [Chloroflexota bacterium]